MWAMMQGVAMLLQNRYQRQRLYTRIALGKLLLAAQPSFPFLCVCILCLPLHTFIERRYSTSTSKAHSPSIQYEKAGRETQAPLRSRRPLSGQHIRGGSTGEVSDSSTRTNKTAQNLVTCIYQAQILGRPHTINMTWSRTLMGQGLSMGIDGFSNQCLCKVEIKPWLFSKRKGSKSLVVENNKIHVFWDLSAAKFGPGPEPLEGFFVAVVSDLEMVLLLGDLTKEAYRRTNARPPPSNAALIARKEHIHGKKVYSTKARFCDNGHSHDVAIECDTVGLNEPYLEIHINKKRVLQIKRLSWKFRGNQTILVDGLPVEVFWDVHSWLFGPPTGNAVFMFQTCLSGEKMLPLSAPQALGESQLQETAGFSLVLYAWKNE
ncbi:hypothetical protein B296_00026237 [Ensete ventricosum]|uniref:DUF868 domain-containing protein n=1 Tax=Ensete ventricosum TaxID=4639 RepID=A0A426ZU94_ENSVE|nr:hypothetical protein B296_00026237 [Ensete ventricosum]